MNMPRLVVFASGSATGGGSGFEKLSFATQEGTLDANIVAVISNHEYGGVRVKADKNGIQFRHFPAPWTKERYQEITREFAPDFIALSGWIKFVFGLDPRITFNIHPAPLPEFGGPGMYGHHVHEAVLNAYHIGAIVNSAVSMHFVTSEYDMGPVFFRMPVKLFPRDTARTIGERVNEVEHRWQSLITDLVVGGRISWDGKSPDTLRVPKGYTFL